MTTVVFRGGVMASDSLGVQNTTRCPGDFQKVWKLPDGTLVGAAGEYQTVTNAIMGAASASAIKTCSEYTSSEILCVRPDGSIRVQSKGAWSEIGTPEFYAIGSGAVAALGALHQGATAEDAIRAAALVDVFTNDKVRTLSFGDRVQVPVVPADRQEVASKPKPFWSRIFG